MNRPSDPLRELAARQGMLITAHRGTPIASVGQNTLLAALGAVRSGADLVEIDATVSVDGVVHAFHDGTEDEALCFDRNLEDVTAAEIAELRHRGSHEDRPQRVPLLRNVLLPLRGSDVVVNLDRSWWRWPLVLDEVAALDMASQVLVKFPANQPHRADALRDSGVTLPTMVICRTMDEVDWAAGLSGIDVCAIELIAESPEHPLAQRAAVDHVHELGLLAFVNCEVLTSGPPLYAGWDDEQALVGPDQPWKRLHALGIDIVQTDWPWLADAWRRENLAR